MKKLRDNDIREALLNELYSHYSNENDTKIVNEMGVLHGQSRVDVAVINGILHGYEIKSESDNLLRLPRQVEGYNQVFDRMTIVVQRNYIDSVRSIIPKWWGIVLVTQNKGVINLREIRKGKLNTNVDPLALSHLLWRDEALKILKERGLQKGYLSKPRITIYKKVCDSLSIEELKLIVNRQLKQRQDWRNEKQLVLNGDSH
ncbi:sce7726 family protein [Bacillus sp. V3B]|uniref:sce7726 family protein n=1 Tax=Bacillus sp. V3B TaxID=2804915 RepID=UPI00210A9CA8|nr:sce7726 family protein [Bacillus sp. V3B]MCQ6275767.1 sce7726 family protein [Bacillus sp. V3B]